MRRRSYASASAFIVTSAVSVIVSAQSPDAGDAPMRENMEITLGLGASYRAAYLGSDESKVRALPVLLARWKNGFYAGVGGIGYRGALTQALSVGAQIGFDPGRDENDSDALRGMGDVKARPELGLFANYRLAPGLSLGTFIRYGSGNDRDGLVADVSLRTMIPLSGGNQRLFANVGATYANRASMQSAFGVSSAQAATSSYAEYTPKAGLRDVSANVGYGYSFSPQTSLMLTAGVRSLQGDAKDSPLTKKATSPTVNALITYRF